MKQSNSSAPITLVEKLRELIRIARHYQLATQDRAYIGEFFGNIEDYDLLLKKYAPHPGGIRGARVLEIGYGARPNRQFIMHAMGVDAIGVDIDACMLKGSFNEVWRMARRNSVERALKSALRFYMFDRSERRALAARLAEQGLRLEIKPERFIVSPAEDAELEPERFDLITSEGVFEHIPPRSLEKLVPKMARWLSPNGLALIAPNIFPGIVGGHITEWVWPPARITRRSEPWDHIRKRKYRPNTYLNEWYRRDYRALFSQYFDIVEERVRNPDLGREYLTPEIRRELSHLSDDELFSNSVLFVLKPRRT